MEGWRQRRLGSIGTDKKERETKTVLTLTGLLMEGLGSLLIRSSLEGFAFPDYSTFITEHCISRFVRRVF